MNSRIRRGAWIIPCVALALTACGADPNGEAKAKGSEASASASAHPSGEPLVINNEGTLTRPFAAPSLADFAKSDFVVNIAVGTVRSTSAAMVGGSSGDAITTTTLDVESVRNPLVLKGKSLTFKESGGIVPFAEVRDDLAAQMTPDELAEAERLHPTVDFRSGGQEHSVVGKREVVFLAQGVGDPNTLYGVVRLVQNKDGVYTWAGAPLAEQWADATFKSLSDIVSALGLRVVG